MAVLAYLITFGTYGARLHGDDRGSFHHARGFEAPNAPLHNAQRMQMRGAQVTLDALARDVVLESMIEVAAYRNWNLFTAHVRTEHVHCVVWAPVAADRVMGAFKAWATRGLRARRVVDSDARVWAEHGSTRWLWNEHQVREATEYVYARQGAAMARYPCE
jgi:REP element-mobilizing transposase RayT